MGLASEVKGVRDRALARRLASDAAVGACLGLLLFGLESLLIVRKEAIGFKLEVQGPFAVLFAAVRPLLPGLLVRVASLYALAGAVLGLASGLLARGLGLERGWRARLGFLAEFAILVTLLAWAKAIARPALFDDLPALRTLLVFCADHGEPWHPQLFAGLWLGLHLVAAGRSRRWRLAPVLGAAGGVALCGLGVQAWKAPAAPAPASARAERPRTVVLFGIDAFRPDRLAAFGSTRRVAPNLERFLGDATLFTHAYTPLAQTEPAWRSLLTARWPHRTGVRYPLTPEHLWAALPTFPSAFAAAGYHTRFETDCSRFHYQGPASGFAERRQPPRGAINFLLEKLRYRGVGMVADNAWGARWVPELASNRALAGIHDPLAYAERLAEGWVETAGAGPVLLAFHATAAHFPGDPVFPFYRQFVSREEPLERRLRMFFSPLETSSSRGWTREGAEGLYDELLAQADAQLGSVLTALQEAGLYDDALIVVFSDHGESFHADFPVLAGSTPVHGARLSDEENRILLAIKPPGRKGPSRVERVEALVRLVDVGPTLLDFAGLPALPEADGVSLRPLLEGGTLSPLRLYAETGFTHASPEVFDPEHLKGAPRAFETYSIRPDGVVEMSEDVHEATLREKDIGAFDGETWLILSPRADGTVARFCRGACEAPGALELERWLDEVRPPVE